MSPLTSRAVYQCQLQALIEFPMQKAFNYHLRLIDCARDDGSIVVHLENTVLGAATSVERGCRRSRFTQDSPQEYRSTEAIKIPSILADHESDDPE